LKGVLTGKGAMIQDDDLAVLKARRDISRANLLERIGEARHLANPGTDRRARADLEQGTRSATMQALEIANDHRGIVVATASALALWLMRAAWAADRAATGSSWATVPSRRAKAWPSCAKLAGKSGRPAGRAESKLGRLSRWLPGQKKVCDLRPMPRPLASPDAPGVKACRSQDAMLCGRSFPHQWDMQCRNYIS
jgi:hypothetical protein